MATEDGLQHSKIIQRHHISKSKWHVTDLQWRNWVFRERLHVQGQSCFARVGHRCEGSSYKRFRRNLRCGDLKYQILFPLCLLFQLTNRLQWDTYMERSCSDIVWTLTFCILSDWQDTHVWLPEVNGQFSTKSSQYIARTKGDHEVFQCRWRIQGAHFQIRFWLLIILGLVRWVLLIYAKSSKMEHQGF